MIQECTDKYESFMKEETGKDEYKCQLILMKDRYFTEEDDGNCGGVILFSENGMIKCTNTINSRLDLCFEEILPDIRKMLFPQRTV